MQKRHYFDKKEINKVLAANIKHLRTYWTGNKKMTQTEFADKISTQDVKMTRGNIDSWERMVCSPSEEAVEVIAAYFKLSNDAIKFRPLVSPSGVISAINGMGTAQNQEQLIQSLKEQIADKDKQIEYLQGRLNTLDATLQLAITGKKSRSKAGSKVGSRV